jgi:hypothetical protein
VPIEAVEGMRRPDLLPRVLQTLDIDKAVSEAEAERRRSAIIRAVAPHGSREQMHVLAMGISHHGLSYAHKDAADVARVLMATQGGASGRYDLRGPILLRNEEVTRGGINDALNALARATAGARPTPLVVVLFSGHGELVDDALYLITHDTETAPRSRIDTSAYPVALLRDKLAKIAANARVLVLLDACHSGMAPDGVGFGLDARSLRVQLDMDNVTVITSSSGEEKSFEDADWQNGAFTEVFLEALKEADEDEDSLIGVSDLMRYLARHVPDRTDGRQTPAMAARFERPVFAAL